MRRPRRLARLAGVAFLIVGVPYVIAGREPHQLNELTRTARGSQFVHLSDGVTHYEVAGPDSGHVIVLVPGTTVPLFVWDNNFPVLADAGLRVVRYDLYGRGHSDRIAGDYDLDLFARQLDGLVEQVAAGAPVTLVGVSLGGLIISEYARLHPGRVHSLVLIDPAGIGTALPAAAKAALVPGVGEYILRVFGSRQLRPAGRMLLHPEQYPAFDSLYLSTLSIRGSRSAVLSTLRNVPFSDYQTEFAELGRSGTPILLIWGEHDRVVPFRNSAAVRELLKPARFVAVSGAAHFPQFERPEVVNSEILAFLQQAGH